MHQLKTSDLFVSPQYNSRADPQDLRAQISWLERELAHTNIDLAQTNRQSPVCREMDAFESKIREWNWPGSEVGQ